jgi:translation initiation factor 3 subunit F
LNRIKQVHLTTGNEPYKKIKIEPVILFSILDSYMRREKESERIVGTLMGSIEDGIVSINNCFVVPHTEQLGSIKLGTDVHKSRKDLHCEINTSDHVVGWFSTAYKTDKESMHCNGLVTDFYFKEMDSPPILLVVDPTFQSNELGVRCYVANNIQLTERVLQQQFKPMNHVIHTHQPERLLFDRMAQRSEDEAFMPLSDLDTLEKSLESQIALLDRIGKHINLVTKGEVEGDFSLARMIDSTLSLIPDQTSEFENMFSKGLQDVLMVIYLAELTKIHLLISESNMLS